ncbi:MAG: hypothetical protein HY619_00785 [Thaumarchaeota archaeon]|nr:hypothetical protein [Nitrososphaerota archaeon]
MIEKEHDNWKQGMEVEEYVTDVEAEGGMLKIYAYVGDNPSYLASVELAKEELEQIFEKFQQVKGKLKTNNELGGE